ncbi:MAG: YbaB/EbfC family nucleoid-associated protein [Patescibacteria group bacterium]
MFDKLKQINELRKMQQMVAGERITAERNGVKVTINGTLMVEEVSLNPDLSQADQERAIKDTINDANKKMQTQLAQKLGGMMPR